MLHVDSGTFVHHLVCAVGLRIFVSYSGGSGGVGVTARSGVVESIVRLADDTVIDWDA